MLEQEIKALTEKFGKTWLLKEETAEVLEISVVTLDRMRKTGKIESYKVGRTTRFRIDEVARVALGEK